MITHAWFRVDEVLPIAEHALACPRKLLATAAVRAGAPRRPARVWRATSTGDVPVSNGAPAWYDERGEEHTAGARMWRHTATGRRHSIAQPGYHSANLPLDTCTDDTPLIELLRDTAGALLWPWRAAEIPAVL